MKIAFLLCILLVGGKSAAVETRSVHGQADSAPKRMQMPERIRVLLIGKDGKVLNAEPISGDPLLLQAATDCVRTSAYKRASTQGVPVEVDTSVEIVFDPERRKQPVQEELSCNHRARGGSQ
jgi:hypothetical protein